MTNLAKIDLLRRGVLLIVLSTLAACASPGRDGAPASQPAGPAMAPVAAPPATAPTVAKPESAHIYFGSGFLVNPPPEEKPSTEAANISLNFEAADVREIARTVLAEILKESYIVDPKVQGTITFRTTRPLPRSALLPTLEAVLRMNGIVLVKENGIFKVMPAANTRGSLSPKLGATLNGGYSIQVVPLKYVGAKEMVKILEPFSPDPNAVKIDEARNLLILAGTQNEIQHMLDTVDMFDVDWLSGMSVGLFTLQSADVKTIDADISKIFGDKGASPLAGVVRLIPIERLNAFVIITPQPSYLEQAKLWLDRLDRAGGTGGGSRLFVYHVQNGKAEHLAELLNQTFGSSGGQSTTKSTTGPSVAPGLTPIELKATGASGTAAPATAARPATAGSTSSTLSIADDSGQRSGEIRIVADKENNALLIVANTGAYEKIESALKRLDIAPRQVLIEVTIAEVTLTDELEYGMEWLFTNGPRRGGKLDLGSPGLNAIVPGFSYAITAAGSDTIKSVLNMAATNKKLNILSSPHIMVADNQTARIQVGDSVPTSGPQTVSGTGVVVSSVQYLDTGVILSVTPHINAGGLVNLDINQEVSTATTTGTSTLNSPTVSKRTTKTIVSVQSGETMVLGGLISENRSAGSTGLPLLSTIPFVGALFGKQTNNSTKTELVVLITPRVADNGRQAKLVSDEFRKKLKEAEELLNCGTSNPIGYTTRGGLWCLQGDIISGKKETVPASQ